MTRPWKHPKSGVYWLRKAVPAELRQLVGKREEKLSLNTKDPAEAKRRHAMALSEIDQRWANLRAGPSSVSERAAHDLVSEYYTHWLNHFGDSPSSQTFWDTALFDKLFVHRPIDLQKDAVTALSGSAEEFRLITIEQQCLQGADACLTKRGLAHTESNRLAIAKAIASAIQLASLDLRKVARGERSTAAAQAITSPTPPLSSNEEPVSFALVVEGWAKERRPVEKTIYEWTRVMRQLQAFLGHDNAARITTEDMVRWKRSMIEADLHPKTIQDAKLAPVRTLLQWAYSNKLITSNPAEDISIDVRTRSTERKRSFTDDEARVILAAALKEKDHVRRWVPWIGAYTGARVSEICQLRKEDFLQIEDIWCIKFSAEAGSLKTEGSERVVPIHSALAKVGLAEFVRSCKTGPIFSELPPDKFGKRGGNGTKVIGRFVRQLGLVDARLSPSHSWRHRMKTLGRRYGLAGDIMNAITGHGTRTIADAYGEYPVEALAREFAKIPELNIS